MRTLLNSSSLHHITSAVVRRTNAVRERLGRIFLIVLVVRTLQEMSDDDATHMAAGVAYYALFSIFPLLLGLIAIVSYLDVLESETVRTEITDFVTDYLPGSEDMIDSNVESANRLQGALGVFAILGLIWSGSAIFGAVARAVNRAWDVHKDRPLLVSKPRQLVMALGVGVLFMLSLSAATFARVAGHLSESNVPGVGFLVEAIGVVLLQGSSFVLSLCIFLLIYKFMPNTRTYWGYIWPGALLAAVLFELAKNAFILFLDRIATFESVYGSLGPVIALLLWTYVSSLILILGAELSSEYGRLRRGVGRGVLLHPKERAVRDETGPGTS